MPLWLWKTLNAVLPSLKLDVPNEKYKAIYHPTLDLPHPTSCGRGTRELCERCLTLLFQVVLNFGNGSQLSHTELAHSIFKLDAARSDYSPDPHDSGIRLEGFVKRIYEPQTCVICKNIKILFDTNEKSGTSKADVRITWTLPNEGPATWSKRQIRIEAKQYDEYPITLGSFDLWKEGATYINDVVIQDNPVLLPLDNSSIESLTTNAPSPEPDFTSTSGPSTLRMIGSWMQECFQNHKACILPLHVHPSTPRCYIPNRLIHVEHETSADGSVVLHARIVEKSVSSDFPTLLAHQQLIYASVSHCWGPAPDPCAPLEGRTKSVLTLANHSAWRNSIPLQDISPTAAQAIMIARLIGFAYVWLDSLCIIQDSVADWRTESATMGDVYRFAWCNIAALWSLSDTDGFLNFQRDPRVHFGFHVPLAEVLGIEDPDVVHNERGEQCEMLRGRARLTWSFEPNIGGSRRGPTPLLTRAWVFQERHLARRTLAFTDKTVYWSCEEVNHCENKHWPTGKYMSSLLRTWQRRTMLYKAAKGRVADEILEANLDKETAKFWMECVSEYTSCRLTKPRDRLIALSSIAKEVSTVGCMNGAKYLAGLWNSNLEDQLLWYRKRRPGQAATERYKIAPRSQPGDKQYAAPTWSWASVEEPIQAGSLLATGVARRLAFVRDANVQLATTFEYGLVEAGFLRLSGRLKKISSMGFTSPTNPWILDEETSGQLNFGFDTDEYLQMVKRRISQTRWFPIRMEFSRDKIECIGLVIAESEEYKSVPNNFIKPNDKVYKRLGRSHFGRHLGYMKNDVLLLQELCSDWKGEAGTYEQYLESFRLREDEFEEFVLI